MKKFSSNESWWGWVACIVESIIDNANEKSDKAGVKERTNERKN